MSDWSRTCLEGILLGDFDISEEIILEEMNEARINV